MALSTDATLAALCRASHVVSVTATASYNGGTPISVPITGGSVTADGTRAVRRSLSLTVPVLDSTYLPTTTSHPLAPFGSEITVTYNVIDPATGTTYGIQQGVFRITTTEVNADGNGTTLAITADDRASLISTSTVVPPGQTGTSTTGCLTLTTGTTINNAVKAVLSAIPAAKAFSTNLGSAGNNYTIDTRWVTVGQDPWQVICDLATAAGQVAWIDTSGTVRTQIVPTLDSMTPTWTYLEDATNVVTSVSRTLDSGKADNGVVVVGQGTDWGGAVRAEVYDTNAASPTNANGVLGKRPVRIDNAYVKTATQASTVASRMLYRYVGQPIKFSMVPNPAMDVYDVVQVQSTALGFTTNIIVDSIDLPLDPAGTMTVQGRARTL